MPGKGWRPPSPAFSGQVVAVQTGAERSGAVSSMTIRNTRGLAGADVESGRAGTRASATQQATNARNEQEPNGAGAVPRHDRGRSHIAAAARAATRRNSTMVSIPLLGKVTLPPQDELAFLAGTALLAAVGVVEWPVALLMGVGFTLKHRQNNRALQDFGEALEGA